MHIKIARTTVRHGAAGAAAETDRAKAPFCSTARLLLQADGISEDELHDLEALEAKRKSSE